MGRLQNGSSHFLYTRTMQSSERLFQLFLQHPVVSTDSRQVPEGCLFFALKGDRFNGNHFAARALAQGAAYAVVDEPVNDAPPDRLINVPDVLACLQELATRYRRHFMIPLIAIAGSNGKTTTKELVSRVLGAHYDCHTTAGNLNNHIGVPLTLLRMPARTEVAVVEMGTNQPGDIDLLCRIAEPTHGLLTNIGKEHLEKLHNLAGVKKEEGDLYRYLALHDGCVFVNLSEKYLRTMANPIRKKVCYSATAEVEPQSGIISASLLRAFPRVEVSFMGDDGHRFDVSTQLFGLHNFQNILTAIALGIYFRVPGAKIKAALEAYRPENNRSQVLEWNGATVLLDAYNANPSSMLAALESLDAMPAGRKAAILGDMLEAGDKGPAEHRKMLNKALKMNISPLALVGPIFARCKRPAGVLHFDTADAAADWFAAQTWHDTIVLVKGSRGIQLEKVVSRMINQNAATPT